MVEVKRDRRKVIVSENEGFTEEGGEEEEEEEGEGREGVGVRKKESLAPCIEDSVSLTFGLLYLPKEYAGAHLDLILLLEVILEVHRG